MVFQSAYSEAYDLTQKMLQQHCDNLLVCLTCFTQIIKVHPLPINFVTYYITFDSHNVM